MSSSLLPTLYLYLQDMGNIVTAPEKRIMWVSGRTIKLGSLDSSRTNIVHGVATAGEKRRWERHLGRIVSWLSRDKKNPEMMLF